MKFFGIVFSFKKFTTYLSLLPLSLLHPFSLSSLLPLSPSLSPLSTSHENRNKNIIRLFHGIKNVSHK